MAKQVKRDQAKIPSKWVTVVVKYGEKNEHLYADSDYSPNFFSTEAEAQTSAEEYCCGSTEMIILVLRVERMLQTKPGFVSFAA